MKTGSKMAVILTGAVVVVGCGESANDPAQGVGIAASPATLLPEVIVTTEPEVAPTAVASTAAPVVVTAATTAAPDFEFDTCPDRALAIIEGYERFAVTEPVRAVGVHTRDGGVALVVHAGGQILGGGCVDAHTRDVSVADGSAIYAVTPVGNGVVVGVLQFDGDVRRVIAGLSLPDGLEVDNGEVGAAGARLIEGDTTLPGLLGDRVKSARDEGTTFFGGLDL